MLLALTGTFFECENNLKSYLLPRTQIEWWLQTWPAANKKSTNQDKVGVEKVCDRMKKKMKLNFGLEQRVEPVSNSRRNKHADVLESNATV